MRKTVKFLLTLLLCFLFTINANAFSDSDKFKVVGSSAGTFKYFNIDSPSIEVNYEEFHTYKLQNDKETIETFCLDPGVTSPSEASGGPYVSPIWNFNTKTNSDHAKDGAGYSKIASHAKENYNATNIAIRVYGNGLLKDYIKYARIDNNKSGKDYKKGFLAYIGDYYLWEGKSDDALTTYKEAYTLAYGNTNNMIIYSHNQENGNVQKAKEYYTEGKTARANYNESNIPSIKVTADVLKAPEETEDENSEELKTISVVTINFSKFGADTSKNKFTITSAVNAKILGYSNDILRPDSIEGLTSANSDLNYYSVVNSEKTVYIVVEHSNDKEAYLEYTYVAEGLSSGAMFSVPGNDAKFQRFISFDDEVKDKIELTPADPLPVETECVPFNALPSQCTDPDVEVDENTVIANFKEGYDTSDESNPVLNVNKCVLEKSDYAGNTYEASYIMDSNKNEYGYCKLYCREEVSLKTPYTFFVKNGGYIDYNDFNVTLGGKQFCYEVIDFEKFNKEVETEKEKAKNLYQNAQKTIKNIETTITDIKNLSYALKNVRINSVVNSSWISKYYGYIILGGTYYKTDFQNSDSTISTDYINITDFNKFKVKHTDGKDYSYIELINNLLDDISDYYYKYRDNINKCKQINIRNFVDEENNVADEYYAAMEYYCYPITGNIEANILGSDSSLEEIVHAYGVSLQNVANKLETNYDTEILPDAIDGINKTLEDYQTSIEDRIENYNNCASWDILKSEEPVYNYGNYKFEPETTYNYDEVKDGRVPSASTETCTDKFCDNLLKKNESTPSESGTPELSESVPSELAGESSSKEPEVKTFEGCKKMEDDFSKCTNEKYSSNFNKITYNEYSISLNNNTPVYSSDTKNVTVTNMTFMEIDAEADEVTYTVPLAYYVGNNNFGEIKVFGYENNPGDYLDEDNLKYNLVKGLPIPTDTPIGTYNYYLLFDKIGTFNDTGEKGRIYGTGNSLSSKREDISTSGINGFACTYTVEAEEFCIDDSGNYHYPSDNICKNGEGYMDWTECREKACPISSKKYCVEEKNSYYVCNQSYYSSDCTNFASRQEALDAMGGNGENISCCPDCLITKEGDDKPICPECLIQKENTINANYRTISDVVVHPNSGGNTSGSSGSSSINVGYNWNVNLPGKPFISKKAEETIAIIEKDPIDDNTEPVVVIPEVGSEDFVLHVKLTPQLANEIREYNNDNIDNGNYSNETMSCYDYEVAYNTEASCTEAMYTWLNGKCYIQNVVCYSSFIDNMSEKYNDLFTFANSSSTAGGRKSAVTGQSYVLNGLHEIDGNKVTDGYSTFYKSYDETAGPAWR